MSLLYKHSPTKAIFLCPSLQTTLLTALTSAQSSIEQFLQCPLTSYPLLSHPDWGRLFYAVFILYKLCLGPPHLLSWDACAARTAVRLDLYLDAICLRLQNICTQAGANDLYSLLPAVFASVRDAYTESRDQGTSDVSRAPHAEILRRKHKGKRKKVRKLVCPALAAWEGMRGGVDPIWGGNSSEDVVIGVVNSGGAKDDETWPLGDSDMLIDTESFPEMEFWKQQISDDPALWEGLPDGTLCTDGEPHTTVKS